MNSNITKYLTWHFHHALVQVIKVVCGGFGIALLTP
ncbi:DUF3265 domain-containing protein [Vibrio diabolicus]|nr:DUF3265 domain-containing protein [Vibrio diabolicus]